MTCAACRIAAAARVRRPGVSARVPIVMALVVWGCNSVGWAQPASGVKPPRPAVVATAPDQWRDLTPSQKQFLQPLEHDWSGLDAQQRRKWLTLSGRAPGMSADERQRIQARMTEWATLTPVQRGEARLRYQDARQLSAHDRQARWDAYQSLPTEQKQQLAARASLPPESARKAASGAARAERPAHDPSAKSNMANTVPNPALASPPKPIGPALLQARPGATTTLIGKQAAPPSHQMTGMPKIAATPEFVDKATLLPQRGAQARAASRPAAPASGGAQAASTPR